MSDPAFSAIISLFGANARLEARFADELGAVHGLSLNESLLLLHLERAAAGRLSRVDLARRLSASPSTVTRLAMPLEKIGLVSREADPRDARVAYVVLTEAGRTLAANARVTLQRKCTEVFRGQWTTEEIDGAARLLDRLAAGQNAELL